MDTITRSRLVSVLQHALQHIDAVDAVWEGGSAAFDMEQARACRCLLRALRCSSTS